MSLIQKIFDYFRSSKNELTKVTWPSRKETIRYSTLVITISLGIAAFFGLLDMGLSRLVNASLANKTFATTPTTPTQQQPVIPTTQPVTDTQTQPKSLDFTNVTPITSPADKTNDANKPTTNNDTPKQ